MASTKDIAPPPPSTAPDGARSKRLPTAAYIKRVAVRPPARSTHLPLGSGWGPVRAVDQTAHGYETRPSKSALRSKPAPVEVELFIDGPPGVSPMSPRDCPRWERCSAPVCPIDPSVGTHLEGERVCFWLVEASKCGGRVPHTPALSRELAEAIGRAYAEVMSGHGPIRRRLRRTAKTGSRIEAGRKLKEAHT